MWEKCAAAFALSLCAACHATAQQPLKAEMTFAPYTSAGQLLGCSFEFTAIHKDRRAKAPFTGVNGTIAWFGDSRGLKGMFKVAGGRLRRRHAAHTVQGQCRRSESRRKSAGA